MGASQIFNKLDITAFYVKSKPVFWNGVNGAVQESLWGKQAT